METHMHPREASECLWHLVHPDVFRVPCEDCNQRGYHQDRDNAGMLTITSVVCPEVCSPEVPTQSTPNLPGHLHIVPRNFSNIHQPPKRCDYITKHRSPPRRGFDSWQTILRSQISKINATWRGSPGLYRTTTKMGRKEPQKPRARKPENVHRALPLGEDVWWLRSSKGSHWYHS